MITLENLKVPVEIKQQQYNLLLKQIRDIIYNEDHLIDNLQNITDILQRGMKFTWTSFYFVKKQQLILGPFKGPAESRQISIHKGACSIALSRECTVIVDDVEQFPKNTPCGDFDRSEIVLPAFKKGELALLLNIGSNQVKNFDETDRKNLQQVMHLIEEIL